MHLNTQAFGEAQKFLAPKHHEISTKNIQQHHSRRCKSPKKHAIDTKTSFKQKNYSEKIPDGAVVSQVLVKLYYVRIIIQMARGHSYLVLLTTLHIACLLL